MNDWNTDDLVAVDKRYLWHPFTSMHDWCAPEHEPLVLVEGHSAVLRDSRRREYIDGNSSIWTNIYGHNHPHINASVAELEALTAREVDQAAAIVIEPMVQGAAGIKLWSPESLTAVHNWSDRSAALLLADEVLTGFGRIGMMFVCQHESVIPDIMVPAKALTERYLPLTITFLTKQIFSTFLDSSEAEKTVYYGHSYAGSFQDVGAAIAEVCADKTAA